MHGTSNLLWTSKGQWGPFAILQHQKIYHGLWAEMILTRSRYKPLSAFLHVVDPANETPGSKLRKVEEFLASFKERC